MQFQRLFWNGFVLIVKSAIDMSKFLLLRKYYYLFRKNLMYIFISNIIVMFQRRSRRQAGFIRKKNNVLNASCNYELSKKYNGSRQTSCSFSPFKDASPEPLATILLTERAKTNRNKPTDFSYTTRDNFQDFNYGSLSTELVFQKKLSYQEKPKHVKKTPNAQLPNQLVFRKNKSYQISRDEPSQNFRIEQYLDSAVTDHKIMTQEEEIYIIKQKPSKIEVELTLAESFDLHCKHMKNRLENQRRKFSKSMKKSNRQNHQNPNQRKSTKELNRSQINKSKNMNKNNKSFIENKQNETFSNRPYNKQNFDGQNFNKQNLQYQGNRKPKQSKPSLNISSQNANGIGFFVPIQSTRSKPITPRQAYNHSFRKWKQLPEVVQKEKKKQKQQELRERLCRVRAHSLEVRKKMRK